MRAASLIQEPPLLVLPTLATVLGLNEAIFIQQVHYWLIRSTNIVNEKKWVYNSTEQWKKQFPFWSERTILRIISNLCKKEVLLTGVFNKSGFDRTKWYTIDYDRLAEIEEDFLVLKDDTEDVTESNMPTCHDGEECPETPKVCIVPTCHDASDESVASNMPTCHDGAANLASSILPNRQEHAANLAGPIPETISESNNKRFLQRTTTTLRTSQLPMEDEPKNFTMDFILTVGQMFGISDMTLRKYARIYGESLLKKECALLKKYMSEGKSIQNPAGWLCSALEHRYEDTTDDLEQKKREKLAAADEKSRTMGERCIQQAAEKSGEINADSPFYTYVRHAIQGTVKKHEA